MSKCEHDKIKYQCMQCKGKGICQHDKRRSRCIDCNGSEMCEHYRRKEMCKDCDLPKYIMNVQRKSLRRLLMQSTLQKTKKTVEYLGCSPEQFITHIQSKMTAEMNFDNIHLDHIKPVSRFNLDNEEEFKMCCHFTNFQPLLAKDNLTKKNRWSDEEDEHWRCNIIYQTRIIL